MLKKARSVGLMTALQRRRLKLCGETEYSDVEDLRIPRILSPKIAIWRLIAVWGGSMLYGGQWMTPMCDVFS